MGEIGLPAGENCKKSSNLHQKSHFCHFSVTSPSGDHLDSDPDLMLKTNEPETWNVTVDKKVVKKMTRKEIKRQEIIFGEILILILILIFIFTDLNFFQNLFKLNAII